MTPTANTYFSGGGLISFSRIWEMPNSNTFDMKGVRKLIKKYLKPEYYSVDPFANKSKLAKVTNDLNPDMPTDYHLDALDFLKLFPDSSVDFVFYDPPYSPRQVSEMYKSFGLEVTQESTQATWRKRHLDEIARITKAGSIVMSFGWNSSGVGVRRGFAIKEILLINHGGSHNDTIVVVEEKMRTIFDR